MKNEKWTWPKVLFALIAWGTPTILILHTLAG